MKPNTTRPRLISWPETTARSGLSKTTIWRLHRGGSFPKPVVFKDARKSLFVESEIDAWILARIAARDAGAA